MASLIGGSNLGHGRPESHLPVRGPSDHTGEGLDCGVSVRLGV